MSVNIDSLDIEISAESSKAEKSLNSLISTLGRIKGAVEKASSLSSVTRRLDALSKAVQPLSSLNAQTEKIDKLVSSLKQLDTLKSVSIKPFIKSAEMLPSTIEAISNTNADTGKILSITEALKSFENLGKNNINPFIASAKKLPEAIEALNSMPDIDSNKVVYITSTLQTFESMGKTNINPFISSAKKLPEAVSALNGMENVNTNKLNQVVSALRTFETLGKNNINSFLNSLKKLPTIARELQTVDFDAFSESIQKASSAVKPLADEMAKISSGFSSLPTKIQRIIKSNDSLSSSTKRLSGSKSELSKILSSVKIKTVAYYIALKRTASILGDYLTKSNEYAENINLFTVAMGKAADESMNFAEKVNNLLGIDISEWIRNQGIFKSITSGFGVVTDKANLMSKNLTQVAYDIASFYNIDTEEAMTKVQSGISGELEPLRRLGYALDVATLQQVAYNHGIDMSVDKMTQAQKSQLRYVAIMEQSKNAMGDMARTITSPANSMRILNQQFEQLKRAIGNIISVLVAKLIPYVQAFVRLLTEAADALAKSWGFELPKIDYSGLSVESLTDGIDDLSNALDDTTDSADKAKKAMQRLAGFDEINVLRNDTDTSKNNSSINTGTDLGIDLPEYDFLSGLEESSDEIYQKMKKFFEDLGRWVQDNTPLIEGFVKLLAGLWVIDKVKKFVDWLGKVSAWFKSGTNRSKAKSMFQLFKDGFKASRDKGEGFFTSIKNGFKNVRDNLSLLQKVAITAATTILGAFSSKDFFYNITKGTLNVQNGFLDIIGMAGSIGMAFALTGPVGGVVTTLGVIVGAIGGVVQAQQEMREEFLNNTFFDGEGAKLDTYNTKLEVSLEPINNYTAKIQEMRDAIQESNDKLETAKDKVENFKLKLDETGELTAQDCEDMKKAIGELVTEIKDNFSLNTETVFDTFKNTSKEVANSLGVDVKEMTTILQGFQNTFNTETSKTQASANSYLDKISKGIKVTPEEQKQFEEDMSFLNDLTKTISENSVRLQEDLKNVKNGAIDFGDTDEAKTKIEEIGKTAENTMTGIKDAYITQKTAIENVLKKADTLKEYGKIDDTTYQNIKKTINDSMKLLEANYDEQKKQAQEKIAEVFGAIQDAYDANIRKVAEADGDTSLQNMLNIDLQFSEIKKAIQEQCDNFDINLDDFYTRFSASANESTKTIGKGLVSSFISAYSEEFNKSKTKEEFTNRTTSLFSGLGNEIKNQVQSEVSKAKLSNFLEPTINSVINSFSDYKKTMDEKTGDFGKWIVDGLNNGMKKLIPSLEKSGINLFSSVYDSTYKEGKFGSPSKKTYQLGEWYTEGFINAISDNTTDTTKSVKILGQKINSSFSGSLDFDSAKKNAKKLTDTFVQGLDTNNITVTFVNMFDVILAKMQIFANNMSKGMNTTLTNMVNSVNSVKVTNGTASLEKKMPTVTVPKMYATGGYPTQGEMFIAREKGAELVGRIGNRTAVASNDQIVEGIKSGVYEAMMSAKGSESSDNQPLYIYTTVYLDNDEIYNSVEKRSRREFMRSNGRNNLN